MMKISRVVVMERGIRMLDNKLDKIDLQKQTQETIDEFESVINEIIRVTKEDPRYTQLNPQAEELKRKFENLLPAIGNPLPVEGDSIEGDPLPVEEGGRRKTRRFKKKRLMTRKYCKKTPCKKMGFTQKASCRPWKNCYRKSKK
jgi:hypothetical protein